MVVFFPCKNGTFVIRRKNSVRRFKNAAVPLSEEEKANQRGSWRGTETKNSLRPFLLGETPSKKKDSSGGLKKSPVKSRRRYANAVFSLTAEVGAAAREEESDPQRRGGDAETTNAFLQKSVKAVRWRGNERSCGMEKSPFAPPLRRRNGVAGRSRGKKKKSARAKRGLLSRERNRMRKERPFLPLRKGREKRLSRDTARNEEGKKKALLRSSGRESSPFVCKGLSERGGKKNRNAYFGGKRREKRTGRDRRDPLLSVMEEKGWYRQKKQRKDDAPTIRGIRRGKGATAKKDGDQRENSRRQGENKYAAQEEEKNK